MVYVFNAYRVHHALTIGGSQVLQMGHAYGPHLLIILGICSFLCFSRQTSDFDHLFVFIIGCEHDMKGL